MKTEFVNSVMKLEPRLAVFDCDGTLWSDDAGEGFFRWELEQRRVADEVARWAGPRYADYKAGKVYEDDMCAELATMHSGMAEAEVQRAADEYFAGHFVQRIFPEMRDLVSRLQSSGCEVWAVSSTNVWVIRAAMKHCGIPLERILATSVEIENGQITDRIVQVPSGEGKPRVIREIVRRRPDAAFGNSRWDTEMLAMAGHAFAVNPNPDLEKTARERGWTIYFPGGKQA